MRIVVLGMHRSGTSALTRLLGFIGCFLGGDGDFNPVRPDNPAGDWERTDVWALNEDILAALGATWCRIDGFDLDRLDAARRTAFEARARDIAGRLDPRQPWAIKDPRLCLTLPVWRPALETPVCLITHREPLQVAHSLRRRDGFPLAVGIALWEAHVLASLRHSRGLRRVAVTHRRLMDDAPSALRALRQELEAAGVGRLHDPDDAAVHKFIDPSLLHGAPGAAEPADYLNPAQQRLAAALEDGSALAWDEVPTTSESTRDLIEGFFELLDARDRLQRDLTTMTADRDRAAVDRDRAAVEFEHKAEEVERLATARGQLEERLRESQALVRQGEELARQGEEIARQGEELARQNAELARSNEELTRQHEESLRRLADVERELEAQARRHDERQRLIESDLEELIRRGTELEQLLELVLGSRRYRYGDVAGELWSKMLLRPGQPRAAEHAQRIVSAFRQACDDISRRRAKAAGD